MRPPLVPHGRELSARELVAQWCPPVQAALCHRCVQCAGGSADPVRRHGSGTAHINAAGVPMRQCGCSSCQWVPVASVSTRGWPPRTSA